MSTETKFDAVETERRYLEEKLTLLRVNHFFYVIHQPLPQRHSTLTVA